jgi:glycosyltransferase involved in cell wall biosynthesis
MGERIGQTVSVAIATYNGAAYVREQLESIAAQTLLPTEIVVSDDGSTDTTLAVVRTFAADSSVPVRTIESAGKQGVQANFYSAFQACRGDVIVYADQDDVWQPEKLALQMRALAAGAVLVFHPSEVVDDSLQPLGRVEPHNAVTGMLAEPVDACGLHAFGHQMMFQRCVLELMQRLKPVADAVAQTDIAPSFDRYIPFCAAALGKISVLREPLVKFRRHASATTQAGQGDSLAKLPLKERAREALARDRALVEDALRILEAGEGAGVLPGEAVRRAERAYRLREQRLKAQMDILDGRGAGRWLAAARAAAFCVRPTGFSNDRQMHALKVTAAALLA